MTTDSTRESIGDTTGQPIPRAIGRVLDLLEIVLAEQTCTLTTASARAGLTPTTALRHLRALEARGYLDRDEQGVFSPGPTILRLAAGLHDAPPLQRLTELAQPLLDALTHQTGESAYLAVSDAGIATYIAAAESSRAIRHVGWVGQNVTLSGTAVGAALREPGEVAIRSGAVEPDITAISMALPSFAGLGMAVSVIGPAHRLDDETCQSIAASLRDAVSQLIHDLGLHDGEVRDDSTTYPTSPTETKAS